MLTTGKYSNFLHMKMNIVGSRVSERKLHKKQMSSWRMGRVKDRANVAFTPNIYGQLEKTQWEATFIF